MAAALPVLKVVAPLFGTLLTSAMAPKPPAVQPLPAPPQVAPPPPTPEVTKAEEVATETPVDTEAARVRAAKRRKEAEGQNLLSLTPASSDVEVLTKSLLGE